MTATEAALHYRARVIAMYERYCPEKPLSHVDFLLTKYQGFEEELMDVLVEKYGPEPVRMGGPQTSSTAGAPSYETELGDVLGPMHTPQAVTSLLGRYEGMEESLLYTAKGSSPLRPEAGSVARSDAGRREHALLVREAEQDRDAVFRQRQEQFRQDMSLLDRNRQQQAAHDLQAAVAATHQTVVHQEKDIRTLRSDLQTIKMRHEETMARMEDEIRRAATELTRAKLELLRLEGQATPGECHVSHLTAAEEESSRVHREILNSLQLLYVYERVMRTHLALYPVTPLRSRLREIDVGLSIRLDTL